MHIILLILKTTLIFSQNQPVDNTTKEIILQGKGTIIAYAFIIKENETSLEVNFKGYEITL